MSRRASVADTRRMWRHGSHRRGHAPDFIHGTLSAAPSCACQRLRAHSSFGPCPAGPHDGGVSHIWLFALATVVSGRRSCPWAGIPGAHLLRSPIVIVAGLEANRVCFSRIADYGQASFC